MPKTSRIGWPAAVGVVGVRDEKRGPGLRGNILVEDGDSATTSGAHAPADPPADSEQDPGQAAVEGSFRGTIRPDAGTHDTGPNPVVTDAHVEASPTGPNPVIHPTGPNPVVPAQPRRAPAEPAPEDPAVPEAHPQT